MAINKTGYSSNQFLNIENYEDNAIARKNDDNPTFYYPGKSPNIYDKPGSATTVTPIQRGFIRGIFPEIVNNINDKAKNNLKVANRYANLEKAPTRRCFFQFNPSLILRSVQASTTTLNPLLQNPNQLLQPIPGQASFEFQLLFNREPEVAAQEYLDANGNRQATKPLATNLAAYGADPKKTPGGLQYSQDQLGDLGVLVDLYVLDSIIGQSITADSINSIQAYWETTKGLRGTGELDEDGKEVQPYAGEKFMGKDSKYAKNLEKVLGNSAFLNPMPIRIVFSSLFMVEGFVTASNVAFHKFSRNMVPTVCQVTLSVQAMYIGFAKKSAFISDQLTESILSDVKNDAESSTNVKSALTMLNKQVQVDIDKLYYATVNPNAIDGTLQDPNMKLNAWFKAIYTHPTYSKKDFGLDFGTLPEAIMGAAESHKSILMWTSDVYKKSQESTNNSRNLKIQSIDMFFYDVAKLPSNANTLEKLIELAEKGQLKKGNSGKIKRQAHSSFWWVDNNDYSKGKQNISDSGGTGSPNKFETAKRTKKYAIDWYGDDLRKNGLDENSLKNINSYFGTSTIVLVVVTLQVDSKRGGGGDDITSVAYKASGAKINPNTQGIKDVCYQSLNDKILTFGAR